MSSSRLLAPAALLVLGVLMLAACGSGDGTSARDSESGPPPKAAAERSALEHIHGLGVDPRSGELFVATHSGLFHAPSGQARLQRVGNSRQDIMGFSVLASGRFLGSGHPDPSENLPPNLGLIESRDRGRSWSNISLLGEADFHVLRSAGVVVYGFDGGSGRLMVSDDAGRRWATRAPPAAMFDLAIEPGRTERIVASTERGVFGSSNGGEEWKPLRDDVAGLLTWPEAKRLYLVDGQGQILRSADGGKRFTSAGTVGGQPSAFTSSSDELYVALDDGTVKRSTDGGASWSPRATP